MSDENQIKATIQTYFDCMFESDSDKAHQAFHPNSKITGYMQGQLQEMSTDQFAQFVGAQSPSAKDNGDTPVLDIISLDIAGDTAVARVRDVYLGLTFLDMLSLLKTDGEWKIYNKLFHVAGEA